ncbi:MAG: hypothetical protein EBZ53_05390 [Verrucomicrobia bacterium]|nr:hypothetical protein [Verrucomicrobiota bacterium]NDD81984.1 hypothetical protein [Verrucomicrobiota bacterium]NDG13928.1 hypothetical protein [Betaproteobacteria bacterium]
MAYAWCSYRLEFMLKKTPVPVQLKQLKLRQKVVVSESQKKLVLLNSKQRLPQKAGLLMMTFLAN